MLISHGRRLAAPWIDNHHFAAARLNRFQTLLDIRHGHDAAVGRQRITAENQHEVGVIDIWNRQQQTMAVHQITAQVMRQLIDRGRRVAIARLQQPQEIIAVGHQPVVMHARVALIDRHGVLAMTLLDGRQLLGHQRKSLVPLYRQPFTAHTAHWLAQAIRIVLDVLQGHSLGANVSTTKRVERVTLD
ncbi:hypothetical protein D3C72_1043310 [compost metagenome]